MPCMKIFLAIDQNTLKLEMPQKIMTLMNFLFDNVHFTFEDKIIIFTFEAN